MSFSSINWSQCIPTDSNTDIGGAQLASLRNDYLNRGLQTPNYQLINWTYTGYDSNALIGFLIQFCTDSNFDSTSSNMAIVGSSPSNQFYWAEDSQITTNGMYFRLGTLGATSNNNGIVTWDTNLNFIPGFSNVVGTNFWGLNGNAANGNDFTEVYGDSSNAVMVSKIQTGITLLDVNNSSNFAFGSHIPMQSFYGLPSAPGTTVINVSGLSNGIPYYIREFKSASVTKFDASSSGMFAYPTLFGHSAFVSALSPQMLRYSIYSTSNMGLVNSFVLPIIAVPGQPTNISVSPGDSQVIVSWSLPLDGGSPLYYTITALSINDGTSSTSVFAYPATSGIVTGLTNNWPYTFTVMATNATGDGMVSTTSAQSIPIAAVPVPGQPFVTSVEAGNASVSVYWTPPYTGGSPTSYTVTATPIGGGAGVVVSTVGATPTNTILIGLTNETTYTLTVTGMNASGSGITSIASSHVTPSAAIVVPGPVSNVTISSGSAMVSVYWNAPATGGPVNTYRVIALPVGGGSPISTQVSGSVTSTYLTGLQNGVAYSVSVTASNIEGDGPSISASGTTTPSAPAVPDPVTNVNAIPGDGQIYVSWSVAVSGTTPSQYFVVALEENNANPPSYVQVSYPNAAGTISGLTNGQAYDVEVIPTIGQISGQPSVVTGITPIIALPGQPISVSAIAGDATASVSWISPGAGGIPSTYSVVGTPISPSAGTTVTASTPYPNTSLTLSGLTNQIPYTFTVTASNGAGTGTPSSPSAIITPIPPPNNVLSVAVVGVTTTSVTVSWMPDTLGSAATSYLVYATTINGSPFTVNAPTTQATITGLTSSTTYTNLISVVAQNTSGSSPPVVAPTFTTNTIVTVPGSPYNVNVTAGNASATVGWFPSASGGGLPATFTVTATPNGGGGGTVFSTVSYPTLSTSITGLTNGVTYTFTVTANNSAGSSVPSASSSAITPLAPPNPVSSVSIISISSTSVTISWIPDTSGGSISSFNIVAFTINGSPFTANANVTQMTIPGLSASTTYNNLIYVQASNALYTSSPTYAPSFTTHTVVTVPGQPLTVIATAGDQLVNVGWTDPVTGGTPDTFSITATPGDGSSIVTMTVPYPNNFVAVTGLTNGVAYTFTVTATNSAGSGSASATSSSVTPEAPPNPVQSVSVVSVGNGSVTVAWIPNTSGGNITSYYVNAPTIIGSPFIFDAGTTQATITGFQNGTTYTHFLSVQSANSISSSLSVFAPSFTPVAPITTPGAITNLYVSSGNGTLTVLWNDPLTGGTPTSYYVTATSSQGTATTIIGYPTATASLGGLVNNVGYNVGVRATNTAGSSATVYTSGSYTPQAPPNPVSSVTIPTVGSGSVTIAWTPDLTGGTVQWFNVNCASVSVNPFVVYYPTTQLTIMGLTNGASYSNAVSVASANSVSISSPVWAPMFSPMQPPDQVTNFVVVAGESSAIAYWTDPGSAGTPTTYTATTTGSDGTLITTVVNYPTTSAVILGLSDLTTYNFTVYGANAAGPGPISSTATIRIGATGTVRNATAVAGDTQATIYWTGPIVGGTPSIYLLTATPVSTGTVVSANIDYPATSGVIPGLVNGMTYAVTVAATNGAGSSGAVNSINTVTPFSTSGQPGAGGDPHIVTIHGEHYMLPNDMKHVDMLTAVDKTGNVYSVTATTRLLRHDELVKKKAFCITRIVNRHQGFVHVRDVKELDEKTMLALGEQSCFDELVVRFNSSVVKIDMFSGHIESNCSEQDVQFINVTDTEELLKTSVGEKYYPRTSQLKSFDVCFGRVVAHISVDPTYADINYVRFSMDENDFIQCSGAIIHSKYVGDLCKLQKPKGKKFIPYKTLL